ncbi:Uncharacterized protein TCM_017431 [Theobroma cacao]|uniref:Uncharacterized protein n=1 Tax=Theobroma cacao TaxID=3641 RepID=A0A061EDF8_THECC|nr:Uncharacterized protein TCM_017431 [Theobroma cacao]
MRNGTTTIDLVHRRLDWEGYLMVYRSIDVEVPKHPASWRQMQNLEKKKECSALQLPMEKKDFESYLTYVLR